MGAQTLRGALHAQLSGERRGAIAIEHGERRITYAQLAAAAAAIADALASAGVVAGTHVGVLAEDRSLVIPAALGILARDCIFVPLDPAHPPAHLAALANAADLRHAFVERGLRAELGAACQVMQLDAGALRSELAFSRGATSEAAYLYFSSGSTGTPKAILGRADALMHFVRWEIDTLRLDARVRVAQLTSPSHDPYLRDVFTPLVAGGTVCIPETRHLVLSPVELGRWIEATGVHLIHCTPTVFRNLCRGGLAGRSFEHLQHVLIAGEQLLGADLAAWYERFGERIGLVNLYGPTETTLAKLYHRASRRDAERAVVPIGRPMPGASVRVMASETREASAGEVGELYLETAFATLGYYKGTTEDRRRFTPDPALPGVGSVTYRTGDLVRTLAGGELEFVGRGDRQVKLRGERLELGRIEHELLLHGAIEGCVVEVLATEAAGSDELVAYYVATAAIAEPELRHYLRDRLPAFMVPARFVRLAAIPVNVNGKVDRASLPRPPRPDSASASAPSLVDHLLRMWRELLRDDSIGPDDGFMDRGGDSLSIMLLIARIETELHYELALWDVFDDLTVTRLAARIANR